MELNNFWFFCVQYMRWSKIICISLLWLPNCFPKLSNPMHLRVPAYLSAQRSQMCPFPGTRWFLAHGLQACMCPRLNKKCIHIYISWGTLLCRLFLFAECSRKNIVVKYKAKKIVFADYLCIYFLKIFVLSTKKKIFNVWVSLRELFSANGIAGKELKQLNSVPKVQIDCHYIMLVYSLSRTKKILPFNIWWKLIF